MSVSILEGLRCAEINLGNVQNGLLAVLPLAQEQLHNAIILLDKGYGIYTEVEPLLEEFGTVEDVPEKPTTEGTEDTEGIMRDPKTVLATMEPWLKDRGSTETTQSRTTEQRAWDSAVFACSEFVRRLTDYDESLAGAVHLLLTPKSQVAESGEPSSSTPAATPSRPIGR